MRKFCFFLAMLSSTVLLAQVSGELVIPSVNHATTTVTRNDVALANGDLVTSGETLQITHEATPPYYIESENPVTVTLTDAMFEDSKPYDLSFTGQSGWSYSSYWNGHAGWWIYMPSGSTLGSKTGTAYLQENGLTNVAFTWMINQGTSVSNYGKFILTCSINGTVVKTHDFTVTGNDYYNFLKDTVSYVGDGNDTIVWKCEKTEGGTLTNNRTFFVGEVEMVGKNYYTVPAPKVQRDFQLIFEVPEQLSLVATVNGSVLLGTSATVHAGDEFHYVYTIAKRGWKFERYTDYGFDPYSYENGWTLSESNFDSDDKRIITPPNFYLANPAINVQFLDASSALITWDGYGEYKSYRLCVSPTKLSGNPEYWKGLQNLTDTFYVATGLAAGTKYYIHLEATTQYGEATEWIIEPFTMREPNDLCMLTIDMQDEYGDGWTGCGIYFIEDGDSTFVTLKGGYTGTATYNSFGETVQIVWQLGTYGMSGYPNEVAFTIYDGSHDVLYRMDMPQGQYYSTGDVLFEGVLCEPMCSLTNLAGTANGTDFNVTWDAEGADSYEVAVLQIINPTQKQLDSAKVSVNTKSYSFEGIQYHGYNVFVRPVNAKAVPQKWQNILVYEPIPMSETNPEDFAQEIELSYAHTGNMMEDAILAEFKGLGTDPLLEAFVLYSFSLEDSTDVFFNVSSETISNFQFVLMQDTLPGAPTKMIATGDGSFSIKLKGKFYLILTTTEFGDYSVQLTKAMTPKPITLDFFESGDFTDADVWHYDYFGETLPAKGFTITPTDTMQVSFSMTTSNQNYGVGYAVFRNNTRLAFNPAYYPWNGELIKDSTYTFIVFCIPGYGGKITDTYSVSIMDRNQPETPLVPVPIALNDTVTGHFDDAAIWEFPYTGGMVYAKAFSITLTDTTVVQPFFNTPDWKNSYSGPSHYYLLYKNSIGEDHFAGMIYGESPNSPSPYPQTFLADTTYILVICALPQYGGSATDSFMVAVMDTSLVPEPEQLPAKPITLDYAEAGDFTDATEAMFPFTGEMVPAKAFSITPEKDIEMQVTFDSPDVIYTMGDPSMFWILFRDEVSTDWSHLVTESAPSSSSYTCELDSGATYYAVIYTLPTYGGKATDTYTLRLEDPNTPTKTILISPDTIIVDAITPMDYIKERDYNGKVYEFVLTEDKAISYSIEYIGNNPNGVDNLKMFLCSGGLYNTIGDEIYTDSPNQYTRDIEGDEDGKHYYFGVLSYDADVYEYRIVFRATPDYDQLPVNGEITVNEQKQSVWSIEDGFQYGNYEAYQVALEKGKHYSFMLHVMEWAGNAEGKTEYLDISLMSPGAHGSDYHSHVMKDEDVYLFDTDGWVVLEYEADSTVVDTVMFIADNISKFLEDSIIYEFAVEEVTTFMDMVDIAPIVKNEDLPLTQTGIFAKNNKVLPDDAHEFHSNPQSYVEEYGAYDALARVIRIGAEDTLFVEFGGDLDATIQFYDPSSSDLLKTIDDNLFSYPYEQGYFVNETSDSITVIVVCSFNEVILTDVAWSLRMSTSEKDLEPVVVTPKASEESITLYESDGVAEALEALSQIILTAVDGEDNIVATLTNNRFGWDVDVVGNTASYEFNDLDLPAGFVFANPQMWVEVTIIRIPDLPTGFINTDFDENGTAYKILRDGQVYIIRDGMVYTIMGQRVR